MAASLGTGMCTTAEVLMYMCVVYLVIYALHSLYIGHLLSIFFRMIQEKYACVAMLVSFGLEKER